MEKYSLHLNYSKKTRIIKGLILLKKTIRKEVKKKNCLHHFIPNFISHFVSDQKEHFKQLTMIR